MIYEFNNAEVILIGSFRFFDSLLKNINELWVTFLYWGEGDPICKQDGVAAQAIVRGLPDNFTKNVVIPDNAFKPGTVKSIMNFLTLT